MPNQPGYPLPDGELGGDEIVCQLVYLPDRPEYWQALLAAIHYFSTHLAWERDAAKRGKDAASNWREAFELTMECWRMACLQDLQDDVAAILVLLRDRKDCCDDNITYGPQPEIETEIEPEVGDPPDYYGETAVTDWDDWLEHVCHNAHVYVDSLVWQAEEMNTLLALGGISIGLLGAALVLLSFAGIGLAISYALVAATAAGILELGSLGIFLTTADDIEDARTDIVCSLMWGTSLRQAVEDALGSVSLDWLSFFERIDYESATAIIYEGGYESEYLPDDTRDDCDCGVPEGYSWQDTEEIDFTLDPNDYGRVNTAVVDLPEITVGEKVATSGGWGCGTYPAGCGVASSANNTYQTLAARYTVIANDGNKDPWYSATCRDGTPGYRYIQFYTLDVAEGIDDDWAATQCDDYGVTSGGHAKRAIGFDWTTGFYVVDSVPGQTPIYFTVKVEHLVWNE